MGVSASRRRRRVALATKTTRFAGLGSAAQSARPDTDESRRARYYHEDIIVAPPRRVSGRARQRMLIMSSSL